MLALLWRVPGNPRSSHPRLGRVQASRTLAIGRSWDVRQVLSAAGEFSRAPPSASNLRLLPFR